jgi:hypothetical protein
MIQAFDPAFSVGELLPEIFYLLMVSSLAFSEVKKLIDTLYRCTELQSEWSISITVANGQIGYTYLALGTRYALRGDLAGTGDGGASQIAVFLCPETFWRTCASCPVRRARCHPSRAPPPHPSTALTQLQQR